MIPQGQSGPDLDASARQYHQNLQNVTDDQLDEMHVLNMKELDRLTKHLKDTNAVLDVPYQLGEADEININAATAVETAPQGYNPNAYSQPSENWSPSFPVGSMEDLRKPKVPAPDHEVDTLRGSDELDTREAAKEISVGDHSAENSEDAQIESEMTNTRKEEDYYKDFQAFDEEEMKRIERILNGN